MDINRAITCHVQWKSKLTAYIAKPDHSLNADAVSKDDSCDLGRWIHSEGHKYAKSSDFAQLVADHKRFHAAAGQIIRKADTGQNMKADIVLGAKSGYAYASNAVVTGLMKMKQAA